MIIDVRNLTKAFGGSIAVDGISLDVTEGEVLSLLGPSGCGKTTTLRCIAGLERPDAGSIYIAGKEVVGDTKFVPPERRGLSMVFQQYALWPHMDVLANVMFGPLMRKANKAEAEKKAKRSLEMVRLWELRHRSVSQLSGGQQQRVALARALAAEPKVVLFDEPLSNLDAKLRNETKIELMELQRSTGFTAVYVTHDQNEAMSLSDRIVVMNKGVIEQFGSPEDIWREPASEFVAEFIGDSNVFDGTWGPRATPEWPSDARQVQLGTGLRLVAIPKGQVSEGDRLRAYISFHDIAVSGTHGSPRGVNRLDAEVTLTSFEGHTTLVRARVGEAMLTFRTSTKNHVAVGATISLEIAPEGIRCFGTPGNAGMASEQPAESSAAESTTDLADGAEKEAAR